MKIILPAWFCVFVSISMVAQEQLIPLPDNSQLLGSCHLAPDYSRHVRASSLSLPFVDDFSYTSFFPDPGRWTSNHAFINMTMPINPPSIGVATLDGLRADGQPYSYTNNNHGAADTLSSQPIDLAGKTPGDSIYLSFWYQYAGRGNSPEEEDSLTLHFKLNDTTWQRVWSANIATADNDTFMEAMLHLGDFAFLHGDFQFRFVNYATRTGNLDHWHIDYVILDEGRSVNNTFLNDVAFTAQPKPLLRNYYAMPLNQLKGFEATELADSLYCYAANHFNVVKNTTFRFIGTEDCNQSTVKADFIETINFPALSTTELHELNYNADITSLINTTTCDSLVISTKYYLNNSPPDLSTSFNDTIIQQQVFHNYLAYDDGSAELGYGLEGTGAQLAYRFHINTPDTLRAVKIHFAHLNRNVSNLLFSLRIWDEIDTANGTSDQLLYQEHFLTPVYVDSLNGYFTYKLDSAILVSGTIYIGWLQSQSDNLRVGFDVNNDASDHIFYNVGSTWKKSIFRGAIMMQPVLGDPLPDYGVGVHTVSKAEDDLKIFPNPASDLIRVIITADAYTQYQIIGYDGRMLQSGQLQTESIDIGSLPQGIYLLRVTGSATLPAIYNRFVKN